MDNIENIQEYKLLYEVMMNKIQTAISKEYLQYGDFLEELNISSLPGGLYTYEGDWIDVAELRKLYDDWLISRKKG